MLETLFVSSLYALVVVTAFLAAMTLAHMVILTGLWAQYLWRLWNENF